MNIEVCMLVQIAAIEQLLCGHKRAIMKINALIMRLLQNKSDLVPCHA